MASLCACVTAGVAVSARAKSKLIKSVFFMRFSMMCIK